MFLRLVFFNISQEKRDEARRIYNEEVVPAVRQQKGNINIMLLEPTDDANDYISLTQWETKADADEYEASGTFGRLMEKIKDILTKRPEVKTYTSEMIGSMSTV